MRKFLFLFNFFYFKRDGQVCDGTTINKNEPTLTGLTINNINLGIRHTCALANNNNVYCCGDN
jgi:hypothetical protein